MASIISTPSSTHIWAWSGLQEKYFSCEAADDDEDRKDEDGEDDEEEHEEDDDDNDGDANSPCVRDDDNDADDYDDDDENSPCIRDATDAVITISQEFDSQAMVLVCQLVKPDDDDGS